MDNELEIVSNNPAAISSEVPAAPSALRTVAPAACGFAAGILAGYGIFKAIEILVKKRNAKKAAQAVEASEKTEE